MSTTGPESQHDDEEENFNNLIILLYKYLSLAYNLHIVALLQVPFRSSCQ